MMRIRLGLALLALLAVADLHAQSLGELAAKEKERRQQTEKKEPSRVVTEEELAAAAAERARTAPTPASTPLRPKTGSSDGGAAPRRGRPTPTPSVDEDPPSADFRVSPRSEGRAPAEDPSLAARANLVALLRERARAADYELQRAERRLAAAEKRAEQARRITERDYGAERELASARESLKYAQTNRDAIEEDARQAGIYPGELR